MNIDLIVAMPLFQGIQAHFASLDRYAFASEPPISYKNYWELWHLINSFTDEQKINLVKASTANVNYFMFVFCLPCVPYRIIAEAEKDIGDSVDNIMRLNAAHINSGKLNHSAYYADLQRFGSKGR